MKTGQIFKQTIGFCWMKLGLGLLALLINVLLFVVLFFVGSMFGEAGLAFWVIWLALSGWVNWLINHYFGYLIKAAHVAVVAEAVKSGTMPENAVQYGKDKVKSRFISTNAFFVVDKLISGSVRQINNGVEKVGGMLSGIPGAGPLVNIAQMFIKVFLNYIDECCLGWVFLNEDQGAFKSSCDGVVIYAQNWKTLGKRAFSTALRVVLFSVITLIAVFIPVGAVFAMFGWWKWVGFIVSAFLVWVIKYAFLDSYIMIDVMQAYMSVAPTTEINFDLYDKLCGISRKFKDMFNRSKEESVGTSAFTGAGVSGSSGGGEIS